MVAISNTQLEKNKIKIRNRCENFYFVILIRGFGNSLKNYVTKYTYLFDKDLNEDNTIIGP